MKSTYNRLRKFIGSRKFKIEIEEFLTAEQDQAL